MKLDNIGGRIMSTTKLMSLHEIFNQKIFRIPDFQRGYSWNEKQLEDFWEDIENLNIDKIHYTGLLTVEPVNRKKLRSDKWREDTYLLEMDYDPFYIIDGQQRITTSIIFVNEMLKALGGDESILGKKREYWVDKFLFQNWGELDYSSYIFGYEKDDPSNEFFKTKILGNRSTQADKVPEETLYTKNLEFARNYFNKKIASISDQNKKEYFRKVVNKFRYNFYEIDDDLDVYVTFETMNNRGKPLSNLELMKNRLIYLTTLLEDEYLKETLRNDINETWKTIYEYLGKNKKEPLNDDEFLKNHWIMYFKYDRKISNSYAKYLLSEEFIPKRILSKEIGSKEIKDYISSLQSSIKTWYYLHDSKNGDYSDEIKEWLNKLNRLGFGAFKPLLMGCFNKEFENEKLLTLLKSCEKFIFLIFRISRRQANTKDSHYYRLANQYYHEQENNNGEEVTIDYIIADIDWNTLGETEDDYYGWCDLTKFKSYIKDLFEKKEGYYSWNGLKYFLYEYELDLQSKSKGETKIDWENFNKRNKEDSIEHIYPQTPKNKYWGKHFSNIKTKKQKELTHSIGNLVPISISKNSELQNREFPYKKKHTDKSGNEVGFFNGSYSEIEIAQYEDWTRKEITDRALKLLDFLEKRWGIYFEDWRIDKISLVENIK